MTVAATTIDHVEGLTLDSDAARRYTNELNSLRYLAQGLSFLGTEVARIEENVRARIPDGQFHAGVGNVPWLQGIPMGLVACSFHWYAVSACNYARMVGWLGSAEDERAAADYARRTAGAMLMWRNKIAAHFSRIDRRSDDTAADLASSVMFPVGFEGDVFVTQPFVLSTTNSTARDVKWSLSRTHDELGRRYWPSQPD